MRSRSARAIALLLFGTATLTARSALAAIGLTVTTPAPNEVDGNQLGVSVLVTSTYAVQSVVVQVANVSSNLAAQGQAWTGTLGITALSYGTQTLNITATDVLNNVGSTSVSFFHHNPPIIQVSAPSDWAVARPATTLTATCTDDTGCLNFRVEVGTQTLTDLPASINLTNVDLSSYNGQELTVTFRAEDSYDGGAPLGDASVAGWQAAVSKRVYVDTSSRLIPDTTVNGMILDFDRGRILFRTSDNSVMIYDRKNHTETNVGAASFDGNYPPYGNLTSAGAVWFSSNGPSQACAAGSLSPYYWNGGQATAFGPKPDCADYPDEVVAGDWVLLPQGGITDPNASPTTLQTIDLRTGIPSTHTFPIAQGDVAGMTVFTNGDVFVLAGGTPNSIVYRDHGGVVTSLGLAGGVVNTQVLTDGLNLRCLAQ